MSSANIIIFKIHADGLDVDIYLIRNPIQDFRSGPAMTDVIPDMIGDLEGTEM